MIRFFKNILILWVVTLFSVSAQNPINEYIIEFRGIDINQIFSQNQNEITNLSENVLPEYEKISTNFDLYLIKLPFGNIEYWHSKLKLHPDVLAIEPNVKLEWRRKPDDPRISEQWYLQTIKAYEAWDITTGGKDNNGNDIVIAVIDDGFDINHEDLAINMWKNKGEIPNDGKDNDGNGYIDDYHGWNTKTKTDQIDLKSHGTNVLGVLGAKGNNGIGIAGINWNVKILPINIGTSLFDIYQAFDYILTERKRFNTSGGTLGSYIVATSYSGGLPEAFASDFPIWCEFYNKLGKEGILNVGATTNDDSDVDVKGDMPSTCNSDYLIIVTSTDKTDEKESIVGYGANSVDLAAPGDRILTTDTSAKGLYKTESGTSLSTPMVAATVGLLYSAGCDPFYDLSRVKVDTAALVIKDIILSSVDIRQSLAGKTVTGGRLNIYNALIKLTNDFNGCVAIPAPTGALKIIHASYNFDRLLVDYLSPNEEELTVQIYDLMGRLFLESTINPPVYGSKIFELRFDPIVQGLYIVSIISEKNVASKFFFVAKK